MCWAYLALQHGSLWTPICCGKLWIIEGSYIVGKNGHGNGKKKSGMKIRRWAGQDALLSQEGIIGKAKWQWEKIRNNEKNVRQWWSHRCLVCFGPQCVWCQAISETNSGKLWWQESYLAGCSNDEDLPEMHFPSLENEKMDLEMRGRNQKSRCEEGREKWDLPSLEAGGGEFLGAPASVSWSKNCKKVVCRENWTRS